MHLQCTVKIRCALPVKKGGGGGRGGGWGGGEGAAEETEPGLLVEKAVKWHRPVSPC